MFRLTGDPPFGPVTCLKQMGAPVFVNPPPCPPWCRTTHSKTDQGWDVIPTAVTRTCERRFMLESEGERHEIALQRFASVEYGTMRCDPPIVRFDDAETVPLAFALVLADSLRRLVELAGEPSLAA